MKKNEILGNNLGMKFLLVNAILLAVIKAGTFMTGLELANFIDDLPAVSATEVVTATNALRQVNQLDPLRENFILDTAAAQKLSDMIANQYFNHVSPLGVNPWHWFDVNQYRYSYAGENLALGFMDAQGAVNAWNDSPSHRANLLNSNYEDIGVAVRSAQIGDSKGFLVVQLFGALAPSKFTGVPQFYFSVAGASKVRTPLISSRSATIQPSVLPRMNEEPAAFAQIQPSPEMSITSGLTTNLEIKKSAFMSANWLYALLTFVLGLIFAVMFLFYDHRKYVLAQSVGYFTLCLLSWIIPVLEASKIALIN